MHTKRRYLLRKRKLVAGRGFVDTIQSISKDGIKKVGKAVQNGSKKLLKKGIDYGLEKLAEQGHKLVNKAKQMGSDKAKQLLGAGIQTQTDRKRLMNKINNAMKPSRRGFSIY